MQNSETSLKTRMMMSRKLHRMQKSVNLKTVRGNLLHRIKKKEKKREVAQHPDNAHLLPIAVHTPLSTQKSSTNVLDTDVQNQNAVLATPIKNLLEDPADAEIPEAAAVCTEENIDMVAEAIPMRNAGVLLLPDVLPMTFLTDVTPMGIVGNRLLLQFHLLPDVMQVLLIPSNVFRLLLLLDAMKVLRLPVGTIFQILLLLDVMKVLCILDILHRPTVGMKTRAIVTIGMKT